MKEEKRVHLRETIDLWQPFYIQSLTEEDAREIMENATGFFRILAEWERKNQEQTGIAGYDPRGTVGNAAKVPINARLWRCGV